MTALLYFDDWVDRDEMVCVWGPNSSQVFHALRGAGDEFIHAHVPQTHPMYLCHYDITISPVMLVRLSPKGHPTTIVNFSVCIVSSRWRA